MEHTSPNRIVNSVLRMIGDDQMTSIDEYTNSVMSNSFKSFKSDEELLDFFKDYISSNNKETDIENIRYYTGIRFRDINAVLRNYWDYDKNGLLTEEKKSELINLSREINESINSVSVGLPTGIKVYRGVSLNAFKDYGVSSISDLKSMVGQYIYERGFTSTSLIRNKSFFDRNLEWGEDCNIEIEYYIPQGFEEGVPLITDELSYSKSQSEFLINSGTLTRIVDVMISDDGKAYITAVIIPKKIWDKSYIEQHTNKI